MNQEQIQLVKIDKDIPIPEDVVSRNAKYPWREMEVGDSFVITEVSRQKTIASLYARYKPLKFISRKVKENGVEMIRIWRVK